MATHSSILARKIPRTVHWGRKELDKTEHMHTHTHTHTQILGLAVDGVESSHGSHQRRAHTHTQISGLAVDGVESSHGSHQRPPHPVPPVCQSVPSLVPACQLSTSSPVCQ